MNKPSHDAGAGALNGGSATASPRWKKRAVTGAALLLLITAAGSLIANKRSELAALSPPAPTPLIVATERLRAEPVTLSLPAVAEVAARRESTVASRLTAFIERLPLSEGDEFRQGDVLAELDLSQARAELAKMQAELAQTRLQQATLTRELEAARRDVEAETAHVKRFRSLRQKGNVSAEELQRAEAVLAQRGARLQAAEGSLAAFGSLLQARESAAAAEKNLTYGSIKAPFDGVVSQRPVQPGDLVTPGKPLLKIIDRSAGTRLLVNIPEPLQPKALKIGDDFLALRPWPAATGSGLRRYEARDDAARFAPGERIAADVVVFRSPNAIPLRQGCLLGSDGREATLVRRVGEDRVEPVQVVLAAEGREGAATTNLALAGAEVVCAPADILTYLLAGQPFMIRSGPEGDR